jgi:hypothetical protein
VTIYFFSPNIVRVIKSSIMRWAGHVARIGEERGVYRVLVGKPEGRNHWGNLGVDRGRRLRWISRRWDVGMGEERGCVGSGWGNRREGTTGET